VHDSLEGGEEHHRATKAKAAFAGVIVQILLLDIVFSLDSVITAVGMTDKLGVMVAAVIGAVAVMLFFAGSISDFVRRHPTVKMLALSFLILIGVSLLGDGLEFHIPKGYVYLRWRSRSASDVNFSPAPRQGGRAPPSNRSGRQSGS
jgi:predicted tellurium resistance membrane protein TerC